MATSGQKPPHMVFSKMSRLVQDMHDTKLGVPPHVKSLKSFLSTPNNTPNAFAGVDLVGWLVSRLNLDDPSEAVHIGTMLLLHGFIYPIIESKHMTCLKDDGTLYRFQTPYYWPSLNWRPDETDYAIHLTKRSLRRNKLKHGLDDQEQVALVRLQKLLCDKWEFILQQAHEQIKIFKQHKKADRMVISSQERTFWRLQRPTVIGRYKQIDEIVRRLLTENPVENQSGHVNSLELGSARATDVNALPPKRTIESFRKEVTRLRTFFQQPRVKLSKICESLIHRCELYKEHDPVIAGPRPSNPWITDDVTFWELQTSSVDGLTERRIKKWSFCLEELLRDNAGLREFQLFLKKEFSSENINFWLAVQQLKTLPQSGVPNIAQDIFQQYLEKGAPHEINIDSRTMAETIQLMESPTRQTFKAAQMHIFLLMKKDSYPRFIKSEQYRTLLANAIIPVSKKKFFAFPSKTRSPQPSPTRTRRRVSAVGTGAAEVLDQTAVYGGEDRLSTCSLSQHSYSTGNLRDIDSDKSESSSMFGSSSTNPDQKTKKNLSHNDSSNYSSPNHKLEVPQPSQTFKHSNFKEEQRNVLPAVSNHKDRFSSVIVPIPPSKESSQVGNVIAPWEDEMA